MERIKTVPFKLDTYKKDKPIIVYGASTYGELAYYLLKTIGLYPDYFCDRVPCGEFMGVKVIDSVDVSKYMNANYIIASSDSFYEIRDYLNQKGCQHIFDMSDLLKKDVSKFPISKRAKDFYLNKESYINIVHRQEIDGIVFGRVQYVVTERCSLRCRDCTHLMQYYMHPENVEVLEYKEAFSRFLDTVETISEIRILGGEPFMNPNWHDVIDICADSNKIHSVSVFTNGTIVPNEEGIRKCSLYNVRMHISDYGVDNSKIGQLIKLCNNYGVKYHLRKYDSWQDAGDLNDRKSSEDDLKSRFNKCFERNSYSFYKGKLFHCARAAHGMNLGAIPDMQEEYIDFTNDSTSKENLIKLMRCMQNKEWTGVCNYCNGPSYHSDDIPAGIQVDRPLNYERVV